MSALDEKCGAGVYEPYSMRLRKCGRPAKYEDGRCGMHSRMKHAGVPTVEWVEPSREVAKTITIVKVTVELTWQEGEGPHMAMWNGRDVMVVTTARMHGFPSDTPKSIGMSVVGQLLNSSGKVGKRLARDEYVKQGPIFEQVARLWQAEADKAVSR